MKRNKIFNLLVMMLMATAVTTFTACSDKGDDDQKQYDDLDYFQKAICNIDDAGRLVSYKVGTVLYENEPQHLYVGVENIEEAAKIFATWMSPEVKLADINANVREASVQFSDKQGQSQGTIYFRAGTDPIVAEVTPGTGMQLKYIDRITFLLNSAWPHNSGGDDMGIHTNLNGDDDLGINGEPDNTWGR